MSAAHVLPCPPSPGSGCRRSRVFWELSRHGVAKRGIPERGPSLQDASLHQSVQTRIQSDPQPAVPVRQRDVIKVLA